MAVDPRKQRDTLKKLGSALQKNTRAFATGIKDARKLLKKAARGR